MSIIKYILYELIVSSTLGQIILLALLVFFAVILCLFCIYVYKDSKKSPEQRHIERIKYLIELSTNIKLDIKDIKLLDYQFHYGWPVETVYKFQILTQINESSLLDFDSYKKDNPPISYEVLIQKIDGNQIFVIKCLDYDDKQNVCV